MQVPSSTNALERKLKAAGFKHPPNGGFDEGGNELGIKGAYGKKAVGKVGRGEARGCDGG